MKKQVKKPKKITKKNSPCISSCKDCCSYCTVLCEKLKRYKARKFINQAIDEYEKSLPSVKELSKLCLETMLKDSDNDSRIWFTDTSNSIAKKILKRIKGKR